MEGTELGPSYWVENLRRPVLFASGVAALRAAGHTAFLEVSPHPVLVPSIEDSLRAAGGGFAGGTLRREAPERESFLESASALHVHGVAVDWSRAAAAPARPVPLPTQPWQRERFWLEDAPAAPAARPAAVWANWLHEIEWESRPHAAAPAAGSRRLLVVGDGGALGEELARRLACERIDARDLGRELPASLAGIVYLGALDATDSDPELAGPTPLALVQAIVRAGRRDPPRLWLVTRGADARPGAAILWGLARTIAHEHPEIEPTRIDLDPGRPDGEVDLLAAEILAGEREPEVSFRGGIRRVARLVRVAEPEPGPAPQFRPDALQLVTGGLGDLGLALADWLAANGARRFFLLGRREPSPEAAGRIRALEAAGARVLVRTADVSRREDLEAAVESAERELGPLSGVWHLAGVLDDATLLSLDRKRFLGVLGPKLGGALHLDRIARTRPVERFVLFGSSSALLGSPGQGNYVAANAALGALAEARRAGGLPALAVEWGPWEGIGMAARAAGPAGASSSRGLGTIPAATAFEILGRLLATRHSRVGVVPIEPRRFRESYPKVARWPLFERLLGAPAAPEAGSGTLRREVEAARAGERPELLRRRVAEQVAKVLRIDPGRVGTATPFRAMGFDSLLALELRNRLEESAGVSLPATIAWAHPTVEALAEHLAAEMGIAAPAAAEAVSPEEGELDDLSEEDVAALLAKELGGGRERP